MPYPHLAVPHIIAPGKEICFADKGAQQWDHAHRIHWPFQSSLSGRMVTGTFKDMITALAHGKSLEACGRVSNRLCIFHISILHMVQFVLQPRVEMRMHNSLQSMVTHEQQFSILFPLLYALLAYVFLFQMGSFCQGHNYFTELKVDFRLPLVTSGSEYPRVNQWRSYIVTRNDWSKLPQGKWTASPQKNVCSVTDSSGFGHALWLRSMGNYNSPIQAG